MAGIFISYRREDTSGEATHLAADLGEELGRRQVFIDIDTISPGTDYTQSIDGALTAAEVVLVLIGDRWLSVTNADGQRRLDAEGDVHVLEIEKALARDDVTVVPVLVEGAPMPTEAQLPPRISALARRNALELTGRRWRYDVQQILGLVKRGGPAVAVRRAPMWAKVGVPLVAVAAVVAAIVIASGGSGGDRTITSSTPATDPQRPILAPATVAPAVDICSQQLLHAVDGTVGPIKCDSGGLNQLAWQTYAENNPVTFGLGPNATPQQVHDALCIDVQKQTIPIMGEIYQLAQLYYGWQFALDPTPDVAGGGCG